MARQRFGIAVLIAMALLAVTAAAQSNEIAGSVGRVFISDQGVTGGALTDSNIHFGNALTYEGNYARRFINMGIVAVHVEVPFVFTPSVKLNFGENIVPKDFRSFFVTPAVRANLFPTTAFSPWIVSVAGLESSTRAISWNLVEPIRGNRVRPLEYFRLALVWM